MKYEGSPKPEETTKREVALSGKTTFSYRACPEIREGFTAMDCTLVHQDPDAHQLSVAFCYIFNPNHLNLQLQLGVCAVGLLIAFIIAAWTSHTQPNLSLGALAQ